ncbi:hypothetical protein X777_00792 [Ooceraea biroi]|uniref:Uncharacterized protein n=1 Tax=Ooceraea biroi TaxID=2015173 RepID=A0A026WNR3_OOCBI|nr:hypothetical protein X777_00792 [Ooceraea biroi]
MNSWSESRNATEKRTGESERGIQMHNSSWRRDGTMIKGPSSILTTPKDAPWKRTHISRERGREGKEGGERDVEGKCR